LPESFDVVPLSRPLPLSGFEVPLSSPGVASVPVAQPTTESNATQTYLTTLMVTLAQRLSLAQRG
jgi:hypothetical protein